VFIICIAGYILAWKGILDKKTQKVLSLLSNSFSPADGRQQLNRINVSIFTPSLLFSKVAFFLSPGSYIVTVVSLTVPSFNYR
jgi:auxin efflux carrier family protein